MNSLKIFQSVYASYCSNILSTFSVTVPVSTIQLKKDNQALDSATLTVTADSTVSFSCKSGFCRQSSPSINSDSFVWSK